jgi:heme oxygenase
MSQEQIEQIVRQIAQEQKRYYLTQARWEALVRRLIGVLQDWFEAMEEGTANHRHPSIDCTITDEQANRLIGTIDESFEDEITKYPEYWAKREAERPPEFSRLELHARRALAEELRRVIAESEEMVSKL